jgi:DNA topoisomerase-1
MPVYRKYKKSPTHHVTSKNLENAVYLIIVESPSKCTKIEGFLGSLYACVASMGHIRSIKSLKDVKAKDGFTPEFTILENKKPHVEKLQEIVTNFDKKNIFIGTDDDREGEAIGWHLCEVLNLDIETTKRIKFHEITESAIKESIKHPSTIDTCLVNSAITRQILDITVGHKLSPLLWRYIYNSKENALSVGRCQTPALRLVYDNHMLDRSTGTIHHKIIGAFTEQEIMFTLNRTFNTSDEVCAYMRKHIGFKHTMKKGNPTTRIMHPPLPFNTSALIQKACETLKTTPQRVMSQCQDLYQQGHITYMRTESRTYSKEFVTTCRKFIIEKFGEKTVGESDAVINRSNIMPHEAIRVTNINVSTITEKDCKALYRLIWKNTIESCMKDASFMVYKYTITAPDKGMYQYSAEVPSFLGWKTVSSADIQPPPTLYLDSIIQKGDDITRKRITSDIGQCGTKPHYSEGSLVKKLEDMGIGRPSTFSSIVQTIIDRKYVSVKDVEGQIVMCEIHTLFDDMFQTSTKNVAVGNEKNKLVITPTGILAVTFMCEHFMKFFNYDYTKGMEDELDRIASNTNANWRKICQNVYTSIQETSKSIPSIKKVTFPIDHEHEIHIEGFGPVIRKKTGDEVSYIKIRGDFELDIEKARNGEYTLSDLLPSDNVIGYHDALPIILKEGQYGNYLEWQDKKLSLKNVAVDNLTLKQAVELIESDKDPSILRSFTPNLSIRRGKYGPYAFYKTSSMPKPKFLNIKRCPVGYMSCTTDEIREWLEHTYKMTIE